MRFNVLGPIEAHVEGRPLTIGGGRQTALLALLVMHAGEVVSRDRLLDELWAGSPPDSAARNLDVYVSRLRRSLRELGAEDVLTTRAPGYRLEAPDTDVAEFAARVAKADGAPPDEAAATLREALKLWRGRPYLEVADEPWARPEVDRLEGLKLAALEGRIDADLALGRDAALVPELDRLVQEHPLRERLVGQQMLALYRSGRQADALAAFRRIRAAKVDALGLEPGGELRDLEGAILREAVKLDLPRAVAPISAPPRRWRQLAVPAAALAAIAAIAIATHDASTPAHAVTADGTAALDPQTGRITASVAVGTDPAGITSTNGRVWVTNGSDGTVSRIDPDTGSVDQTLKVGTSPAGIAGGAGAIWVANAQSGTVSRVDPKTAEVVQTIPAGARPVAVAVDGDTVWVADAGGGAVIALDARTGAPKRTIRLSNAPAGVAVGDGAMWVTEPLARRLERVDPTSGAIVADIDVGGGAGPVAIAGHAVWVVNRLDGTLARVDTATNAVTSTVPVGEAPRAVAAGSKGVWVAGSGGLIAIDPRTGAVRHRYPIGSTTAVTLVGDVPWTATSAPATGKHRGGTLRIAGNDVASAFDPARAGDFHPALWAATGDGLLALTDAAGAPQLVPDLAIALPRPTDNGRTYSFRLRPGIRYSTGVPVRASDFRRGLERLWSAHSQDAGLFDAINGADACTQHPDACALTGVVADDRAATLTLHLTRPDPQLPYKLAEPPAHPVPPGTPRTVDARTPVPSTGPYKVASFTPQQHLVLVRNPQFHAWSQAAQPDGFPDRIDFRVLPGDTARIAAVLHDRADLAVDISAAKNLQDTRTRFASQVRSHEQPFVELGTFNARAAPFNDARARRALNLVVDRRAVAARFGGPGSATPACELIPPTVPGHTGACPTGGLAKARALVRASGTAGMRVDILIFAGGFGRVDAPPIVRALKQLGYAPHVTELDDINAFAHRISAGDWSISEASWIPAFPSASELLQPFTSCASYRPGSPIQNTNAGGYCNRDLDRLVAAAEAAAVADPGTAERLWERAARLATDDAAVLPLVNLRGIELLSRRAGHFVLDANGLPRFDQLWVR